VKKQRKETRLKRKRLKAAHNTILEENRRLKGWQSVYGRKEIRTFGGRKIVTIFEAGSDSIAGFVHREMAQEMGMKLAQDGILVFDTEPDSNNCGIVVRARVDVIRPM